MTDIAAFDTKTFSAVDKYIVDKLVEHDHVLDDILKRSNEAGLPAINVSAAQGKMLYLLAKIQGARRILEVGTLAGYSAVWMARALPKDGKLVTLEFEEKHAAVARESLKNAGFEHCTELHVGPAAESMRKMIESKVAPFDMIFIDADKESYSDYFDLALKLARSGTQIISDNIVRSGEILDPNSPDPRGHGIRAFLDKVAACKTVESTGIQTAGSKGYDGFALSVVL